jgi:hypothetical protein
MKAAAGAILAPLAMWAVRSFLTMGLPFDPSTLPGLEAVSASSATLGTFFVTSLAIVGAVFAGFFDADNQPGGDEDASAGKTKKAGGGKQRIAAGAAGIDLSAAEEEAAEAEAATRKRRR